MGSVKWRLTGWRYFGTRCSTYSIIKDTTVIVAAVPLSAPTNRIKSVLGFELPISRMFIGFALAPMYYLWSMVYRLNWMSEFSPRTLLVTPTPPPLQSSVETIKESESDCCWSCPFYDDDDERCPGWLPLWYDKHSSLTGWYLHPKVNTQLLCCLFMGFHGRLLCPLWFLWRSQVPSRVVLKYLRGRRVKVVQLITRIDVGLLLLVTSLSPSYTRYH